MPITRLDESERASAIVVHNNTVYLSGQVGDPAGDIKQQTRDTMSKVEALLEKAGSDKTKMLKVEIWLKDIEKDFAPMVSYHDLVTSFARLSCLLWF
jgi:enamine deaminase RidA (YjgF/YER057c/UK114 family)